MQNTNLNASWLASLPVRERGEFIASLTAFEAEVLLHDWPFWARSEQLPPLASWRVWLLLAGRGFGKTRSGAEWIRARVNRGASRTALVAPTAADARSVMVEGESGILAICPRWERPDWQPSNRCLVWPNGSVTSVYSADEPDRLRGPQFEAAWCDELAAWRYPETWDMLMLGLRLGDNPQCVVTTTPRPTALIRNLLARPDCTVSRGTTYDNRANLAPAFLDQIIRTYEGTRLGRQEIFAEVLEDVAGALWQRAWIEQLRRDAAPPLQRIVVAVDPSASSGDRAAECGIVVVGLDDEGRGYVLADYSVRGSPIEWATRAVSAYHDFDADNLVAEVNQGGEMVETIIRQIDSSISYKALRASRGKTTRAEPVAALYEQKRVYHVGVFEQLEDQMCAFVQGAGIQGGASPDRVDALVWGLTDLMLKRSLAPRIRSL